MTKVNLCQTTLSHVSEICTLPGQNVQVNQGMKRLFVWSKKGAISKNWITKLETKFAEREKKMNRLENELQ